MADNMHLFRKIYIYLAFPRLSIYCDIVGGIIISFIVKYICIQALHFKYHYWFEINIVMEFKKYFLVEKLYNKKRIPLIFYLDMMALKMYRT